MSRTFMAQFYVCVILCGFVVLTAQARSDDVSSHQAKATIVEECAKEAATGHSPREPVRLLKAHAEKMAEICRAWLTVADDGRAALLNICLGESHVVWHSTGREAQRAYAHSARHRELCRRLNAT